MRAVSLGNGPPPAGLTRRNRKNETELDRFRAHLVSVPPPGAKKEHFTFAAYKSDDVKDRLRSLFHGKCAYCESFYESQAPVDVEHFRPKGRVQGAANHPGYWWLAAEWTNLLPSCLDCNRRRKQSGPYLSTQLAVLHKTMQSGKHDFFPVQGVRAMPEATDFTQEQALLLNPTIDDPEGHLAFWLGDDRASGLVYPASLSGSTATAPLLPLASDDPMAVAQHALAARVSVRGAVSIQVYGLNRVGLVQERSKLLQQLRFLESVLVDGSEVSEELETLNLKLQRPELTKAAKRLRRLHARVLDQMRSFAEPEAPLSATAKAYLRDFKRRLMIQS